MTARYALLLAAVVLLVAGCSRDTIDRMALSWSPGAVDRVAIDASIDATGTARVCETGTASKAVAPRLAAGAAIAEGAAPVAAGPYRVCWTTPDAAKAGPDAILVALPLSIVAGADDRKAPSVRFELALELPAGSEIARAHLLHGSPQPAIDRSHVRATGRLSAWQAATLELAVQSPTLAPAARTEETLASLGSRVEAALAADRVQRSVESRASMQTYIWVLAQAIIPLFGVVAAAHAARASVARRYQRRPSSGIVRDEPPTDDDPLVIAAVLDEARKVPDDARAAALLWWVVRGVGRIDTVTSREFFLSWKRPDPRAHGSRPSWPLVEALWDKGHQRPPAWDEEAAAALDRAWPSAKRNAVRALRRRKLIASGIPAPWLVSMALTYFVASIPLGIGLSRVLEPAQFRALVAGAIGLVIAVIAGYALHQRSRSDFELTRRGYELRDQLLGYREYISKLNLDDMGAAGVVVWGEPFVYAMLFGLVPNAPGDLATGGAALTSAQGARALQR